MPNNGQNKSVPQRIQEFLDSRKPNNWDQLSLSERKKAVADKLGLNMKVLHTLTAQNKTVSSLMRANLGGKPQRGTSETRERSTKQPEQPMQTPATSTGDIVSTLRSMNLDDLRNVIMESRDVLREKIQQLADEIHLDLEPTQPQQHPKEETWGE